MIKNTFTGKVCQILKNFVIKIPCYLILITLMIVAIPFSVYADGTSITGEVPLIISQISITGVTTDKATVNWSTNAATTSQVFYDISSHPFISSNTLAASYAFKTTASSSTALIHSQDISGLTAGTTYYFRLLSTANITGQELTVMSVEFTLTTNDDQDGGDESDDVSGGGGGGGGGGGPPDIALPIVLTGITSKLEFGLSTTGQTQSDFQLTTSGRDCTLDIKEGTSLMGKSGDPLTHLSATRLKDILEPPPENAVILAYDFGPNGARFEPPLTLTMRYESSALPAGTDPEDLKLAFWNGTAWETLVSSIDTESGTVSAKVSHFTNFAIICPVPEASPLPTTPPDLIETTPKTTPIKPVPVAPTSTMVPPEVAPQPPADETSKTPTVVTTATNQPVSATFLIDSLRISPAKVRIGEPVTISVMVTNLNRSENKLELALGINGLTEERNEITLKAGENRTVYFVITRDKPGSYNVDVSGMTGEFRVGGVQYNRWLWLAGSGTLILVIIIVLIFRSGLFRRE